MEMAGFEIVDRRTHGRREIKPEESLLGREAQEHGVKIHILGQSIRTMKP